MKFSIKVVMLVLLVTSCNKEVKQERYIINGNAAGIYNGIRVYLKSLDQNGRLVPMDTAIVMNEKFTFEGKVLGPEMGYININSVQGSLPLVIENNDIEVVIDKDNLTDSKVSGSKTNEALLTYNLKLKELSDKRLAVNTQLRAAAQTNDNEKVTALNNEMTNVNVQMLDAPFDFVKNNGDNFYSLMLLENMLRRKNTDLAKITEAFDGLDSDLKNSIKGKALVTQVEEIKKLLEAQANTEIGKIAPEFSAPTPEGTILSLSEVKSKVTIIDFWAAWCGPCRRENPNLVQIYSKYHDKGLEIIGVSLDGTPRQANAKGAWIQAIQQDNLTWPQISNLNYFEGPIAKMYNIKSIPSSFVLDAEGKIIAKSLRGPALEAKISELLD